MDNKTKTYLERAEKLKNYSQSLDNKRHTISDLIPFGQPVLVGHHSEGKSRKDIKKMDNLMHKSIEVQDKAEYWELRAKRREKRLAEQSISQDICQKEEKVKVGDSVLAKFTNAGNFYQFKGEIVGYTKNEWKVKALISPYPVEQPGRVFYIPNMLNRKFSINNCVVKL